MAADVGDIDLGCLPPVARRFVEAAARLGGDPPYWVRKGDHLFQAGAPVSAIHAVLDGAVVRRKVNVGGEPLAVDLVTRGGIVGFRAWLGYGVHRLSAQCVTDCLVCRIPAEALDSALAADRTLEQDLLADAANDLGNAQDRILQVATLSVRDRLLVVLAQLSRHFTTMNDERTLVLAPPISRTDMAALAGMTPESLSRCIRALEADGLAHFSRRHVVIPSAARFRTALADIGVAGDGAAGLSLAG